MPIPAYVPTLDDWKARALEAEARVEVYQREVRRLVRDAQLDGWIPDEIESAADAAAMLARPQRRS